MRAEPYGIRLINADEEAIDIVLNTDGEGFLIKLGGAEWWIEDIHEFVAHVTALANPQSEGAQ